MKLKFFPREDLLVREAGITPRIGEAARYYGRTFDPATRSYPAVAEPIVVEPGSEDGDKLTKQCRKGTVFAADAATAAAIGVAFVASEFKDGAHLVKAAASRAQKEVS